MKKNTILTSFLCFAFSINMFAQHSTFFDVDDALDRGYIARPYLRYEAEEGKSRKGGNATYLPKTFDQRAVQSEASNQQAIQLNNVGDYVEWTNSEVADGMTIRFSIPDNAAGTGTTGKLNLYVNEILVLENIELDSRWAWQYFFARNPSNGEVSSYAHNVQSEAVNGAFPRMRFDELRVKLADKIPTGATFRLTKADKDGVAYTIDFVELELIPAKVEKPIGANVVEYTGNGSDLNIFVAENGGKTIYIPEGKYDVPARVRIMNADNTKLIGAGMWHTQLHFTAPPTNSARGIESNSSNVEVSGFYITTVNERRYTSYVSGGTGKGFDGSFGTNSKISDVWVTHFECGAWISSTDGLHISQSRFRSNYADGINLARGSKNVIVKQCSFRNNGDDDMASWSSGGLATENIIFINNTSENNWRAGAVGFFGGKQNKALNLLIIDPLEDAIRANDEFSAAHFSDEGFFEIRNISIYRAGSKIGVSGQSGNLWGHRTPAISLTGSAGNYDVRNFIFSDIDIYDTKGDAIMFMGRVGNVFMKNITIDRVSISDAGNSNEHYGVAFFSASGYNNILCIDFQNIGENARESNVVPNTGFLFNTNCEENTISVRVHQSIDLTYFIPKDFADNMLFETINGQSNISIDVQGRITGLNEGTATIKVTDASNAVNNMTYTVIVRGVAVTGVSISEETVTLAVGQRHSLAATIEPANATNKNLTWASSSTNIAEVNGNGRITAVRVGTATITVTTQDGRYTKTCRVTVVPTTDIVVPDAEELSIATYGNEIQISGYAAGEIISIYNLLGTKIYSQQLAGEGTEIIRGLRDGIYVVVAVKAQVRQKVMIKNRNN